MSVVCLVCRATVEETPQGTCPRCGSDVRTSSGQGRLDDSSGARTSSGQARTDALPDTRVPSGQARKDALPEVPAEGVSFGRYLLLERIGRGGMGVVYRALDREIGRVVALKTLLHEQGPEEGTPPQSPGPQAGAPGQKTPTVYSDATPPSVQRLLREARTAARLAHPNVVSVLDVGVFEGRHFFTMELIEGIGLERWLQGERRPGGAKPTFREVALVIEAAARGLAAAHHVGIVHRDVKPSNILVDAKDQPHLGDFGLAKDFHVTSMSGLTLPGSMLGTPSFMSPEHASGRPDAVGPLSDVFSLGAVLYYALTGIPPFGGTSVIVTLRSLLEDDPLPPSKRNPDVQRDLEVICLKALEKNPRQRYSSVAEMADDLARFARHEPIHARPRSLRYRAALWLFRHQRALAAAAVLAAVAFAALWFAGRAREQGKIADVERRRAASLDLLSQAGDVEKARDAAALSAQLAILDRAIEADRTCALAWLRRGRARERLGQLDLAIEDYSMAGSIDRSLAEAWYHVGCVRLFRAGWNDVVIREAEEDFSHARAAAPDSQIARLGLAYSLAFQWKRAEAVALVDELAKAGLRHPDLFFLRAALHSFDLRPGPTGALFQRVDPALVDYDSALEDLTTGLELDPLSSWGRATRGRILFHVGDLEGAMEDFDAAFRLAPDNDGIAFIAARAALATKRLEDCQRFIDRAIALRDDPRYLSFRALLAISRGDYAGARPDIDRALSEPQTDTEPLTLRAVLRVVEGDEKGAEEDFQAVRKTWGDALEKIQEVDRDLTRDPAALTIAMRALSDFDRIFALPPARKKAMQEMQRVFSQAKGFARTMELVDRMREANPEVAFIFADVLGAMQEKPELQKVFDVFMRGMGLTSPLFAAPQLRFLGKVMEERGLLKRKRLYAVRDWMLRAGALYRQGSLEAALADLVEAERKAPADADVLYAMATLCAAKGEGDRAVEELRKAIAAGWGHKEYTAEDADFAGLRGREDFQQLTR